MALVSNLFCLDKATSPSAGAGRGNLSFLYPLSFTKHANDAGATALSHFALPGRGLLLSGGPGSLARVGVNRLAKYISE
jgi:hypothetical protein